MSDESFVDVRVGLARLEERQRGSDLHAQRIEIASKELIRFSVDQVDGRRQADWAETQRRFREVAEAEFIRRETYDRERVASELRSQLSMKDTELKVDSLSKELELLKLFNSNLQGRMWIGGAVILILAGAIAALPAILAR